MSHIPPLHYSYTFDSSAVLAAQVFVSSDDQTAVTSAVVDSSRKLRATRNTARRGVVRGMSTRSARRLRRMLSFIEYTRDMSFVTLTYRECVDVCKVKRDLEVFFKHVKRRFARVWAVWKLERQRRGAWHIHILFVNIPFWHWRDLVSVWARVSGQDASRATNIRHVRSLRELRAYLSKYIAKASEADEETHTGRVWGVFNRKCAFFVATSCFLMRSQFFTLRRVVRRLRYNVKSYNFWIYKASSIVTRFIEQAFDVERVQMSYKDFSKIAY